MSIAERGEGLERILNSDRPMSPAVQTAIDDVKRDIESSVKREVLRELDPTGDYSAPSAAVGGEGSGGLFALWIPGWYCGDAANDLVSVNCGNATVETVWVEFGDAS